MDSVIVSQKEIVQDLQGELKGPVKHHTMTQTVDSGMLELQYARQEVYKSQ